MSSQEIYSINAAAKLTGYSVPTIRKRLPALKNAGAIQKEGAWQIPLSALHEVGLMVKVEGGQVSSKASSEQVETLRLQLAQAEARALVAEALASEREKALERMDYAMRMIETKAPRRRWGFSR